MQKRQMKVTLGGHVVYESIFDTATGNMVRKTTKLEDLAYEMLDREDNRKVRDLQYGRHLIWYPSPSPETIDIAITETCDFGCPYCYVDSTPNKKHEMSVETLVSILTRFAHKPYQVALGGGEPTQHSEFAKVLQAVRDLGIVPNYTTNGSHMTEDVIAATNSYCGGIAFTWHMHKGLKWLKATYRQLRSKLSVQLNVHVLADNTVLAALDSLIELQAEQDRPIQVVLLGYVPQGRGTLKRTMPARMAHFELPLKIKEALSKGVRIAFSEALIPYFLTHKTGINTDFVTPNEGHFSCYIDVQGNMYPSSFNTNNPPAEGNTPQEQWENLDLFPASSCFESCSECPYKKKGMCRATNRAAALLCARQRHVKEIES